MKKYDCCKFPVILKSEEQRTGKLSPGRRVQALPSTLTFLHFSSINTSKSLEIQRTGTHRGGYELCALSPRGHTMVDDNPCLPARQVAGSSPVGLTAMSSPPRIVVCLSGSLAGSVSLLVLRAGPAFPLPSRKERDCWLISPQSCPSRDTQ